MKRRTTMRIAGILLLFTALWFLSADITRFANAGGSSISRLPDQIEGHLRTMDKEIAEASELLACEDAYILLRDRAGGLQEYNFEGGILWKNGSILMHHVQSFHFEFRDYYGYRLTRLNEMSSLESVGYTVRLISSRKPHIAGNRILLDGRTVRPQGVNDDLIMVLYSLK